MWPEDKPDVPAVPTFRDFMEAQLNGRRKKEISYGTWKRDEITWRTRVYTSDLGKMPIDQVTDDHCQAFIDAQKKLVPKRDENGWLVTVDEDGKRIPRDAKGKPAQKLGRQIYTASGDDLDLDSLKRVGATLSVYFEIARLKPYKLIKVNPMADVEYPRERKDAKPARKTLTLQQAAKLRTNLLSFTTTLASQGARFEAMVMTARDTGFRRGELCALRRDRLGRRKGARFIIVDVGLARAPKGFEERATKTGKTREVPITKETYDRIMALPRKTPEEQASPYVFFTSSGRPVSPDNFTADFRAFRKTVGIPHLKLHNLRHTYISLMLRAGVDLKTVQNLVGHASPKMIMEIYAETFNESMEAAPGRMAEMLSEIEEMAEEEGFGETGS
ncbi:MAG: tyrosine-type recombinase/integrase [Fimbriimonas sp.]